MSNHRVTKKPWLSSLAALLLPTLFTGYAHAVNVRVVGPDGAPITTNFSYVVEKDLTFDVIPDVTGIPQRDPDPGKTLSLSFHRSHMPVVESGTSNGATASVLSSPEPGARYFISVMPAADPATGGPAYTMSGVPIRPTNNALPAEVTVVVDPLPLKTAQISVMLFDDSFPINNQPDGAGAEEKGLCGFDVHVYDAGGTYGASGGRISQDVFGNPLGTVYEGTDADGAPLVKTLGTNVLRTDRNGVIRIKNLAPAKYTIYAFQPRTQPSAEECPNPANSQIGLYGDGPGQVKWGTWRQTSTIEGTWGIDAWVKADEPTFFKEFGPPGHHVFMGFVKQFKDDVALNGNSSVSGQVVSIHASRPPAMTFYNGTPVGACWIGLNEAANGTAGGRGVYAGPCSERGDGTFEIKGLKPGLRYQLAVWDEALDNIFATYDFVTPANGGEVALNQVPVFNWFSRFEGKVCHDENEDGFCKADESGVAAQNINLRFRDGSIYQSSLTDDEGNYVFEEMFPFFNWLVAEVDFARFKATGATRVVDNGGEIPTDQGWAVPSRNVANPQPQGTVNPATGNDLSATDTGPVLLYGIQNFLGQTQRIEWGKKPYPGNEHGGITGVIRYASTRAEWDPRFATQENNEPGIPNVTVRLYRADPADPRKALGGPIATVKSDSWDAALPSGCKGPVFSINGITTDCYDGLRNFNQVRLAVFDGGYAFTNLDDGTPLEPGNYIVEVVPPLGYEIQKEEDKNVDFGDFYAVSTLQVPPECVGTRPTPVPEELTLFPGVKIPAQYRFQADGTSPRPYCNMKAVTLSPKQNAAADFNLFTKTPVAGHIVGMILDDLANEFSPYAPSFGEKYAPPFMPISLRDHAGREFSRVYSDRYGTFNALVPSSFSFNVPIPSGVSPNMVTACLNSPTMPDPERPGKFKLDPYYNRQYSQFCYQFQYLPGKTTYLDTPVIPIAAFAGPQQYPLDCAQSDAVPGIHSVTGNDNKGPYVSEAGGILVINSLGLTDVTDPLYNQDDPGSSIASGHSRLTKRDYGFGSAAGKVVLQRATDRTELEIVSWSNNEIQVRVPALAQLPAGFQRGTLLVTHANGNVSPRGVTVHVGGVAPKILAAGQTIQQLVDSASDGDLLMIPPGNYEEGVIVDKRVRLQGFGAAATIINPVSQPEKKLSAWRELACRKVIASPGVLLPGQTVPAGASDAERLAACVTGDTVDNAPLLFATEEMAGFFVLARDVSGTEQQLPKLQIDGFTVAGSDIGGAIVLNGYGRYAEISNNVLTGNQGVYNGGVRLGHALLVSNDRHVESRNTDVSIHHNEIVGNGNSAGESGGGGGGISVYYGSDRYNVSNNFVCGNYSTGDGGGMAHQGVSRDGIIANNKFLYNQSFYQARSTQGGGLSVTGAESLVAANGLSTGTGNVTVNSNLFQGNLAAAGDGGGISMAGVNGAEIGVASQAYRVDLINNIIVNNVAGVAGGGIALQDTVASRIINNTIVHNDSTATGSRAFEINVAPPPPNRASISESTLQPGAGIVSRTHTPALTAALGSNAANYSDPQLVNNIVYENRSFNWKIDYTKTQSDCAIDSAQNNCYSLSAPTLSDLAVIGGASGSSLALHPTWTVLTNISSNGGYSNANNTLVDANGNLFRASYFNGPRDAVIQDPETTTKNLDTAAAFDEGGNFIDVRFGPLTQTVPGTNSLYGNYRPGQGYNGLALTSDRPELQQDADGISRGAEWSAGAVEK